MKQRRTSWPQDMKITMSNQWYDTVQDMMELTSTSYELAVEREALLSELTEVREAVTEARTQLEEREAEISDLTQHFLQVILFSYSKFNTISAFVIKYTILNNINYEGISNSIRSGSRQR